MKDELSKSELFELSGEYSSGNSNLDELNSLEFSNLDLDVCFLLFKYFDLINELIIISIKRTIWKHLNQRSKMIKNKNWSFYIYKENYRLLNWNYLKKIDY
jgi:hypothetical protein